MKNKEKKNKEKKLRKIMIEIKGRYEKEGSKEEEEVWER